MNNKYKNLKSNARKEYLDAKREIKYWEKVEKFFKRQSKKNVKKFKKSFKHSPFTRDYYMDDESIIESIARKYSFDLIEEKLTSHTSTYTFMYANYFMW